MPKNWSAAVIADEAPCGDALTDYDRAHFVIYARLLDAVAAGANEQEVMRLVLAIDPTAEPMRARRRLDSHLCRARWLSAHGYQHLVRQA
ncbi:MAG: hypothetical protein JSR55_00940 [Proteobacteria bacterium]|nr:hypothetical protein [Pseudomonadota bacterium]